MRTDRIFTIPPGRSFVDALALGLLAQAGGDPLALAGMMVLLPTRRAARGLSEAFLRASDGKPLLLPRMVPLADLEPDPLEELTLGGEDWLGAARDLPPAVSSLRRQFLLTQMVLAAGPALEQDRTGRDRLAPDRAFRLAGELAKLIDQVATEGCDFADLAGLAPADYADHWQMVLAFLTLVTERWPAILAEEGALDPADRRNHMLTAQAEAWRTHPPAGPVIAAGSTGSVPATAALLDCILDLPQGCVVLPGLDRTLDGAAWADLPPSHPQYGLARLLERFDIERRHVRDWPYGFSGSGPDRAKLLSLALHPAPDAALWHQAGQDLDLAAALGGVSLVACRTSQEEAGAIALMMRQTLETPGATCALVTPDRDLGRRVAAELRRWEIDIDDSAGLPLGQTPPGTLLRLLAAAIAADLAPAPLLALLKHPLVSLGLPAGQARQMARRLDRLVLRGPRPAPGPEGLRQAVQAAKAGLTDFTDHLLLLLAPLITAMTDGQPLARLLECHLTVAEALAATDQHSGAEILWRGEAGSVAAALVDDLGRAADGLMPLAGRDYAALLTAILQQSAVRPHHHRHPRLAIWGPLEARMQQTDRLILAGLNEGTWPADPGADPWMSRPMRAKFGLPAWERRIGLAAHDFAQGFGAPDVILTRSERVEGAPSVPSRWLRRLEAAIKALGGSGVPVGQEWRQWQAALDRPSAYRPWGAPEPRPPVDLRPRQLSATWVGRLLRDPYQVYARYVLNVQPLEPLDADPGGAERGTMIHDALDQFVRDFPAALPERDLLPDLLACGEQAFGAALERPDVWAFWWPRYCRMAAWFLDQERDRRPDIRTVFTERRGQYNFTVAGQTVSIKAFADRIEWRQDGCRVIVDYKTGTVPSKRDVQAGREPQLAVEGLILRQGGFAELPGGAGMAFEYWKLGGSAGGKITPMPDADDLVTQAETGVRDLFAFFLDPTTPFYSRPLPMPDRLARYDDYGHLARLAEWSNQGDGL